MSWPNPVATGRPLRGAAELESTAQTNNPVTGVPAPQHTITDYWNLEITGQAGTLLHRMSNASLDNLTNGFSNAFGNR